MMTIFHGFVGRHVASMMGDEWGKYEAYDELWDDPSGPLNNQPEWMRCMRRAQQEATV
jgi:hypothetical protein